MPINERDNIRLESPHTPILVLQQTAHPVAADTRIDDDILSALKLPPETFREVFRIARHPMVCSAPCVMLSPANTQVRWALPKASHEWDGIDPQSWTDLRPACALGLQRPSSLQTAAV